MAEFVRITDAAKAFKVALPSLYRWHTQRRVAGFRDPATGRILIDQDSLRVFLASRSNRKSA